MHLLYHFCNATSCCRDLYTSRYLDELCHKTIDVLVHLAEIFFSTNVKSKRTVIPKYTTFGQVFFFFPLAFKVFDLRL